MNEYGMLRTPLNKNDLEAAVAAARVAECSGEKQRHGAVLFRNKKIYSMGFNRNKTHPLAINYYEYPYIHAEFDALIKSASNIPRCSLAVVRINKEGKLLNSKPCNGCLAFMKEKGVKYVIFSDGIGLNKVKLNG